ncbi:hypothetical protein ACNZ70_003545 [Vibrio mimicus]
MNYPRHKVQRALNVV